jgi:hypothetical protein
MSGKGIIFSIKTLLFPTAEARNIFPLLLDGGKHGVNPLF